jgi:hypothetical protein
VRGNRHGLRLSLRNEGRPASHAGFVIERATGEGEGFIQPRVSPVVGLETQDASDFPLLASIREGHRELATLELDESAVVRLNDPRNLQGADLVVTGRLVVGPPNRASHPRTGERPISSTHQRAHLVSNGSEFNRSLVVQFEGEEQFELIRALLTFPLYRLHDYFLSFHARVCVLGELATRKSPSITRAKGCGVGAIDMAHSAFRSARVLRLLLGERIKHGTATGRSLSCAE